MWELSAFKGQAINALTPSRLVAAELALGIRLRYVFVWALLLGLTGAGAFSLRTLAYSTSLIVRVDEPEVLDPPSQKFTAGPLLWDLDVYRTAPELQAFRDTFGPRCAGLLGVEAARCVVDGIKEKSPRGEPKVEFVDAVFDPAAALSAHMHGAPGHCTSRSAMTATGLLSLGVAARIVQVLPLSSRGHNVVEVWDPAHGWLLFDPHHDSSYLLGTSFVSAVELSHVDGGLRWRRPNDDQPDVNTFAGSTINYPEPWLYTRVGDRCASWPFRGCFAQVGPSQFRYGFAQRLALGSVALFGAGFGCWTAFLLARIRRRRAGQ